MEKDRKTIIVKEINYWKEHHLLPEQYCDFLLALYTEGEISKEDREDTARKLPYYLFYYFFSSILLLVPPLILQTTHDIWLQIIANLIVLVLALLMVKLYARHPFLNDSYAIMIFLLCFLFSSSLFMNQYFSVWWVNYVWVLLNSLVWIMFGLRKGYFFVKTAGVFILIILVITFGFRAF